MKRVNLVDYFELAEALHNAKQGTEPSTAKGVALYVSLWGLAGKLRMFAADDNGFSATKHVAAELANFTEGWLNRNVLGENQTFDTEKFERVFNSWEYSDIGKRVSAFRSVFEAECRDIDVYSVGQIGIYRTSALVAEAASIIPDAVRMHLPDGAEAEFGHAGKCLAFDLPTACGFHALRGLELVMDEYLQSFGVVTKSFKSWNDYIQAAKKLIEKGEGGRKPSAKVTAMLDRMRELDRNPLMHPRDTLDVVAADQLFKLSAVTVVEMVREMKAGQLVPANEAVGIAALFADGGGAA